MLELVQAVTLNF